MRLLLVDNYDSFTFNVVQRLGELGAHTEVVSNDALTVAEALARPVDAFVLSPGPCTPDQAGICMDLVRAADPRPLLGICLGHQAIGQALGARVVRAPEPVHGRASAIRHTGTGLYHGLPEAFEVGRYHSLVVQPESLPVELRAEAWTDDGQIMGLRHRDRALVGVQFHPESILTPLGHRLLGNWLDEVRGAA